MNEIEDLDEECSCSGVQLGLAQKKLNPLFKSKVWKNWDGGCIGGVPKWLDQHNIPNEEEQLTCQICKRALTFLLQLYCPLDEPESAFHRCLYLFICRRRDCVSQGSVKCFRSQLARENPYYSAESEEEEENKIIGETKQLVTTTNNKCAMCR